jgi:hypothetical protein
VKIQREEISATTTAQRSAGPGDIEEEDLDSVRRTGYATEAYERWQFGQCATYARALMRMRPGLKFGAMGVGSGQHKYPTHYFAHDDRHAYDSAGRHPLPYHGITHHADYSDLDQDPHGSAVPTDASEEDITQAQDHARRNGILDGCHERQAMLITAGQADELGAQSELPPAENGSDTACNDCGRETLSTRPGVPTENYMVHDQLWQQAGADRGRLCIGCLEGRLGRQLARHDFPDVPINDPSFEPTDRYAWSYRTERLTDRWTGPARGQSAHSTARRRPDQNPRTTKGGRRS